MNTGRTPRFFSEAFHVIIIYVFFNEKNYDKETFHDDIVILWADLEFD